MTWVTRDIHTKKGDATILKEVTLYPQTPRLVNYALKGASDVIMIILVIMNICLCNQFRVRRDQQLRNVSSHYEYENC